jgi:hypothetical protein
VLAFCPDSVVDAFMAAEKADALFWAQAAPWQSPPGGESREWPNIDPAVTEALRAPGEHADRADSRLIEIVRDKMLGTRLPEGNHSLIGKVIFIVRSRASLR